MISSSLTHLLFRNIMSNHSFLFFFFFFGKLTVQSSSPLIFCYLSILTWIILNSTTPYTCYSSAFSAPIEMIIYFLSLILLIWYVTFINFCMLNHIQGDETWLIMIHNSFNVLLNSVCWNFVCNFCIYIHEGYWHVVFFFVVSLSEFGIRVIMA